MTVATLDIPLAVAWGQEPDTSARSALVTILGDTVAPLGGTVWLADLITLAAPFGFNDRLVRTSMFRLVAEGWVESERVGRRSRYSLTRYGADETESAERRIYRHRSHPWDGSWTLVFRPASGPTSDELDRHLRWRGFARMADGVHARPNDHVAETRRLLDRLALDPPPPVAAARFDGDGEAPLADSPFRDDSGLAEAEEAYHRFVERHAGLAEADLSGLSPVEAFTVRTMVVHDLRRARLRDPELPPALLADDWVGHRAVELAAGIHDRVTERAWIWVAEVTGHAPDPTAEPVVHRFDPVPTDSPEPIDRPHPTDAHANGAHRP